MYPLSIQSVVHAASTEAGVTEICALPLHVMAVIGGQLQLGAVRGEAKTSPVYLGAVMAPTDIQGNE